ncbi:MAG: hypothetical protein ACLGPL_03920 [Acidobacteriota bacterium]
MGKLQRLVMVLLCIIISSASALSLNAQDVASRADQASADPSLFKTALEQDDFSVKTGKFIKLDFGELCCKGIIPSCNANNFGAPYILGLVPRIQGEAERTVPFNFRMRPDEAVVFIGPTPPPCRYYSYISFLYSRYSESDQMTKRIFASVTDPMNDLLVKTGSDSIGGFNKNVIVIYAADANIATRVRHAALASGFAGNFINTYTISPSFMKLGVDAKGDEFGVGLRTALFDNPSEGSLYQSNPGIVLYRVTPNKVTAPEALRPLPTPNRRVRGTGKTEMDLQPALDELRQAILNRYTPALKAEELHTTHWLEDSYTAIQDETNDLGESSDALYLKTKETIGLSDDPDDFLIVYGVNHESSNKCTYYNLNVYEACKLCGIGSVYSPDLKGTAWDYISGINANKLYAYKVARNCNGEAHCLEVKTGSCPDGVPLDAKLFVGFRQYVEPATKVGPSPAEILYDRVIKFEPSRPTITDNSVKDPKSGTVVTVFPDPATITFTLANSGRRSVTWNADLEYPCCGTVKKQEGTVRDGNGQVTVTFTPEQVGTFDIKITAQDDQGRNAIPVTVTVNVQDTQNP